MKTKTATEPAEGFRTMTSKELINTNGGWDYKGPILPHIWLKLLIEELRKK